LPAPSRAAVSSSPRKSPQHGGGTRFRVNVAIILGTLWDTGSNGFLTLWALAVLSAALLAARAWLRARRNKPKEASARTI
jgi:hypothetical protein